MAEQVLQNDRKYKTIVTDFGKEKVANAVLNGKKVNIVTASVGDGGGFYYVPTPDMITLKNEVWRGDIANKNINPESKNMIDAKIVLDGTVGGFTVREVGLFDDEGDLIAIGNVPDTEKAIIKTGAAATLTIIMHVVFTDIDVIEFKINPYIDTLTTGEIEKEIKNQIEQNPPFVVMENDLPIAERKKCYLYFKVTDKQTVVTGSNMKVSPNMGLEII